MTRLLKSIMNGFPSPVNAVTLIVIILTNFPTKTGAQKSAQEKKMR